MNTTTTEDNRARLLNMAAGGDGHIAPYIEQNGQGGYIVVVPPTIGRDGRTAPAMRVPVQSEEAARGLLHAIETGANPRAPKHETTTE